MSLEHAPQRQKRGPRKKRSLDLICVSPEEFCKTTGISRPTAYRMMQDGHLPYTQITVRLRKIPVSEYTRLCLVAGE